MVKILSNDAATLTLASLHTAGTSCEAEFGLGPFDGKTLGGTRNRDGATESGLGVGRLAIDVRGAGAQGAVPSGELRSVLLQLEVERYFPRSTHEPANCPGFPALDGDNVAAACGAGTAGTAGAAVARGPASAARGWLLAQPLEQATRSNKTADGAEAKDRCIGRLGARAVPRRLS